MRSGFIRFSAAAFLHVPLRAQWLHYVTAGIPRTAGGKPNLTASALRTSDGKPDLSGIWLADSFRWNDLTREGTDAPMLPAAAQLYKHRVDTLGWDRPMTDSMPQRVPHALTVRVSRSRSCRCQLLQFFLFEEFNLNAG
jgi:hypothetical protein